MHIHAFRAQVPKHQKPTLTDSHGCQWGRKLAVRSNFTAPYSAVSVSRHPGGVESCRWCRSLYLTRFSGKRWFLRATGGVNKKERQRHVRSPVKKSSRSISDGLSGGTQFGQVCNHLICHLPGQHTHTHTHTECQTSLLPTSQLAVANKKACTCLSVHAGMCTFLQKGKKILEHDLH